MTRNFTSVIPGWYRTRSGEIAEVFQVLDARFKEEYPGRGFIGKNIYSWTKLGDFHFHDPVATSEDLIEYLGEEKPREKRMVKKTLECWVNVYQTAVNTSTDGFAWHSKEEAEGGAAPGLTACVEVTGEYEVEEDA